MIILETDSVSIASTRSVESFWNYNNRLVGDTKIRVLSSLVPKDSATKTPVIFIHGFGGNADQFRYNMPVISENGHKAYAIDLLGYGYSDKPNPKNFEVNALYNFETWAEQTAFFIEEVVREPSILVCNSIGGLVGLQTSIKNKSLVKGIILINISLRQLHKRKQSVLQRPVVSAIQTILRETPIGQSFFSSVAQPETVRAILRQAYSDPESIDDETLDIILKPGLLPGASNVFLDFISYSDGPLPEDMLPQIECPVRFLWGERDPWEPIAMGRAAYSGFPCVDSFVPLAGAGHCPMDQVPDRVNAEILSYLRKYTS